MARIFTHPDGSLRPYPHTRELAKHLRSKRYDDRILCDTCLVIHDTKTTIKHTASDQCVHCARMNALNLYNMAIRSKVASTYTTPEILEALALFDPSGPAPHNAVQAVKTGQMRYISPDSCAKHGHLGVRLLTGECYYCDQMGAGNKERIEARKKREAYYMPATPCPDCGKVALRHTGQNYCIGCKPLARHDANRVLARGRGQTWYTPIAPCLDCGQTALRHTQTNRCQGCAPLRSRKPDSPRKRAITAGEAWYTPDHPCPRCHTLAQRRVNNGQCKGCQP